MAFSECCCKKSKLPYFLVLLFANTGKVNSTTDPHQNNAQSLYNYLFQNYNRPAIIPLCINKKNVTVKIDMALRELVKLDEKHQLIQLKIWMRLKWRDCTITWNSTEFNGIESITVPYDIIWVPDITLYEGSSDEENMPGRREYFAQIKSDGTIRYNFPSFITASCRIDVTYFPYDKQNCSLKFGSWIHHGNLINIEFLNPQADTEVLVSHNEWNIVSVKALKHVIYYNCCPEPYPDVTYYVILARFPKFYILTIFMPCVIISLLSVFGVMLPAVTGEKMTLQVTILLSIIVFLLLVQEKLPSSSDTFPYLGIFFVVAMFLTSLSCVMSGITIYLYHGRLGGNLSGCTRSLCLNFIPRCLCIDVNSKNHSEENEETNLAHVETHSESKNIDVTRNGQIPDRHSDEPQLNYEEKRHERDVVNKKHVKKANYHANRDVDNINWHRQVLAHTVDRIFMIVYILLTSLNILSFLFIMRNELNRF